MDKNNIFPGTSPSFTSRISKDTLCAYQAVPIHPIDYTHCGLKWKFHGDNDYTYMIDKRLMFGARKSPGIFHRITQSIRRMLENRNVNLVVYQDDFWLIAPTRELLSAHMNMTLSLLRKLGFGISWHKVEGPSTIITFLGITINSQNMMLTLPEQKLSAFKDTLHKFATKKRASRRQLESLYGKMAWAQVVVKGGSI